MLIEADSTKNIKVKNLRIMMVARFLRGYEGITSHIATLARELQKNGCEVALACGMEQTESDSDRGIQWLESQGIKHYQIPFPSFKLSAKNLASFLPALSSFKAAIEKFKPDIIHAHSLSVCPYVNLVKIINKIPFVSTCHMNPYVKRNSMEVKISSFISLFKQNFLGDRIIAISKEVKESYQTIMHVNESNIKSIYHGIDSEHFRPPTMQERLEARAKFGLTETEKVVCLIGRLSPFKGHKILFEALAQLKSQSIKVIALCAGTGEGKENICQYADKLGVAESVKMLGFADSRQVIWASDAIVLPSQREALPLVICEAMLCGIVPIRTPASGAYDQINDGVDGFLIPFDDSECLALRLQQLFGNLTLKTEMSLAALTSAKQKFTVERMGEQTIELYSKLCLRT